MSKKVQEFRRYLESSGFQNTSPQNFCTVNRSHMKYYTFTWYRVSIFPKILLWIENFQTACTWWTCTCLHLDVKTFPLSKYSLCASKIFYFNEKRPSRMCLFSALKLKALLGEVSFGKVLINVQESSGVKLVSWIF